ncbi:acetyl-CoA hydrolase/transferase family protein [Xanthocytophaga agilis]|uniref:Acetyl-CoA hydrolase/transferase C-terminal domain-containing protein n=1 Tax=Xanthocytophaga agilis TaxID=3048010 RepID=A0AAE3R3E0_9BACT|nr:acetyl-CoA hydrolase/transferase C-terminal domain-containing protein [Xanthocytophaga agilis]MDJ1500619.1 acetyl-CoA hydrolase/transferase C-terminal domain-containing protein [Xanthocytophaga agilis]
MQVSLQYTTAEEAVKYIQSGNRVFVHSVALTPHVLLDAMTTQASRLENVELLHIHTEGVLPYMKHDLKKTFHSNAMFVGANHRKFLAEGYGDYIPIFLSDIHLLFYRNILPLDVAMIMVSPPDEHGYCSLGCSVDVSLAAVRTARYVIAEINPSVPRTHGDGFIHVSQIHAAIEVNYPIYEVKPEPLSDLEISIGRNVAGLVEDGATLQMGIGGIPNAVLAELKHHKHLGIHTEMFSDGLIDLFESGAIDNSLKKVMPGKIVSCFAMGTRRLYDFINNNPAVAMKETSYTNDTSIIRRNPKVTAINSAIEVDLTGQICADTIGTYQYSGVGGQMDFIRGAALSEGGKPIIALASTTSKGESKIVSELKPGAAITTTRAHARFIVTEYGVADLFGKTLKQRAKELIAISHPSQRENLERAAFERFHGHYQ